MTAEEDAALLVETPVRTAYGSWTAYCCRSRDPAWGHARKVWNAYNTDAKRERQRCVSLGFLSTPITGALAAVSEASRLWTATYARGCEDSLKKALCDHATPPADFPVAAHWPAHYAVGMNTGFVEGFGMPLLLSLIAWGVLSTPLRSRPKLAASVLLCALASWALLQELPLLLTYRDGAAHGSHDAWRAIQGGVQSSCANITALAILACTAEPLTPASFHMPGSFISSRFSLNLLPGFAFLWFLAHTALMRWSYIVPLPPSRTPPRYTTDR